MSSSQSSKMLTSDSSLMLGGQEARRERFRRKGDMTRWST